MEQLHRNPYEGINVIAAFHPTHQHLSACACELCSTVVTRELAIVRGNEQYRINERAARTERDEDSCHDIMIQVRSLRTPSHLGDRHTDSEHVSLSSSSSAQSTAENIPG